MVKLGWDRKARSQWMQLQQEEQGMEAAVQPSDILAVEADPGPASTPIQWSGTNIPETCGTIVFWTKGG